MLHKLSILFLTSLLLVACSGSKKITDLTIPEEIILLDTMQIRAAPMPPKVYQASEKRENDLLHTKLELSFDFAKRYVLGKAYLTLKPYFYPTNKLVLDAKGFDIHEVAMIKGEKKDSVSYQYDGFFITIDLGYMYTEKDEYQIFIDYTAKPDELDLKESDDLAITKHRGLYFIDPDGDDPNKPTQIWTQGETESSSCWFPTIDSPNERTTQEIYLTVPDKYVTLSNGKMLSSTENEDGSRTDYWKQEIDHAPYLFMLTIGDFAVIEDSWRDIEVNYYIDPEYAPYAQQIFGNTPEMMEFYSKLLAYDYPWDKYHQVIVHDFVSGAMENTSAVVFLELLNMTDRELLDQNYEYIIAHEVFHHWFGDIVTCESWSNIVLNEAFATYGEYLWKEHKYGLDEADLHHQSDMDTYLEEAETEKKSLIRFYYEDKQDMFDRHSYDKGGRTLHMLRKYMGDPAFFRGLNIYLKKNEFQPVEIHHLRMAFEEASGEDLNWFFNQWFFEAGHPVLEITQEYDADEQALNIQVTQTQEEDFVFQLPVAIDIYVDGKKTREKVVLKEKVENLSFPLSKEPDWVNFDAEKMLLCEKEDKKPIEAFIAQYKEGPLYLDRYEAVDACAGEQALNEDVQQMMVAALNDTFWAIRSFAAQKIKFEKATQEEATEILKKLAIDDPKSQVRADAINKLGSLEDKDLKDIFVTAAADSSYLVASTALQVLADLDTKEAMELAKKFESEKNTSMAIAVAKIYSNGAGPEKESFFKEKIEKASTFEKYVLVGYYADFVLNNEEKLMDGGIDYLKDVSLNDDTWWVRLVSTRALNDFKNIYEAKKEILPADDTFGIRDAEKRADILKEIIGEVKEKETNERLKEIYKMLH